MPIADKFNFAGGKCTEPGRLDGKLVIVTGANTGIGKETAAELARRGANVIMACRNTEKAEEAKEDILSVYGEGQPTALVTNIADEKVKEFLTPVKPDQLIIEKVDLGSFKSVREFVERIREKGTKIDILINNAGVFSCPYGKTEDGFELQIGINHLGHFLLTELLIPEMNSGSRIIILSSKTHLYSKMPLIPLNVEEKDYNRLQCYCRSKLANAMYAQYLSKKLSDKGILTASVHPGVVRTEISRDNKFASILFYGLGKPFSKNPWQGAQTTLYCVLTPDLISGAYYADCAVAKPNPLVLDEKTQKELISASLEAVGL